MMPAHAVLRLFGGDTPDDVVRSRELHRRAARSGKTTNIRCLPVSLMAFLLGGWFKSDDDDINDIPVDLRDVYINPWKVLGVAQSKAPWELRDAFRQRCLQMTPAFTGLQAPTKGYSFRQVLFAYRMCTGELAGPAGKLSQLLETSPLVKNIKPWDILNVLRPLKSKGLKRPPSARASKMLAVSLKRAETMFDGKGVGGLPRVSFTVEVSYCMRNHQVQRYYSDFEKLHKRLCRELIILPCFPERGRVSSLVGGKAEVGRELCDYVQRVHSLLAQRGVFSPRVMEFLEVDFARVHIEEEGRVVSENLDSRNLLPDTCWQVVDQPWLARWRKFVMGRGARRYHPPEKIDNWPLLTPDPSGSKAAGADRGGMGDRGASGAGRRRSRDGAVAGDRAGGERPSPTKGLVLGEDYRVVNFNVWRYWLMVYGGGPSIGRAAKDIYSRPAIGGCTGFPERFWREYFFRLANENAGAKEALYEQAVRDTRDVALAQIEAARRKRLQMRVARATKFTQVAWRRKKGYAYQVDKLETQQHIQDVFEKADSNTGDLPKFKSMVVREVKGIVNIGGAEEYTVRFDEDTGLNLGLRQRGGHDRSGIAVKVRNAGESGRAVGDAGGVGREEGGRGRQGEQTVVFEVPPELHSQVKMGSVLLAINNIPVTNMSHRRAMAHIRQAAWPLVLRFRLPLDESDVFSLAKIAEMRADGRFSEDIVLEHLKRKLLRGQTLLRFPQRKGFLGSKPYRTRLSIDEHNLYYQGRDRTSRPEGSRRSILLYNLRFVTRGKSTTSFRTSAGRMRDDVCFSIAADGKTLDFAVLVPVPDDGKSNQRCELLVWGLKCLIHEMQGSQVYVDKDGTVKRRVRPKHMLTTVHRQHTHHHHHHHHHHHIPSSSKQG